MKQEHENIRDIYVADESSGKTSHSEKALPRLAGSAGAIAFTLGLMIMAISDKMNIFVLGLSGLGLILMIVFVLMDFQRVKAFLTSRTMIYSTNMLIVILALLGILVIVNAIAANHYVTVDLTRSRENTLSDQTRKILDEITKSKIDLKVTAFIKNDDPRRLEIDLLLERFSHFAAGFKYDFVDYEVKKKLAVEKEVDRPCVLIETEKGSKKVYDFDERSLAAGLIAIFHPEQKIIGLINGHGELSASGESKSISDFLDNLEKENYQVKPIDIAKENGIPQDISVVLIAAPSKPYSDMEIDALKKYSDSGGAFALFLEPFEQDNLQKLLDQWGIENPPDMIIDMGDNYFQDETVPVIRTYGMHPITENFLEQQQAKDTSATGVVMPTATSLAKKQSVPKDVEIVSLGETSEKSWGETSSESMVLDPTQDKVGPLAVALAGMQHNIKDEPKESGDNPEATGEAASSEEKPKEEEKAKADSRFVVIGDSDMITNASLKEGSNFDFAMNTINWLSEEESMIASRASLTDIKRIELEPGQVKAIQIINILLPILVAAFGVITWLKRR